MKTRRTKAAVLAATIALGLAAGEPGQAQEWVRAASTAPSSTKKLIARLEVLDSIVAVHGAGVRTEASKACRVFSATYTGLVYMNARPETEVVDTLRSPPDTTVYPAVSGAQEARADELALEWLAAELECLEAHLFGPEIASDPEGRSPALRGRQDAAADRLHEAGRRLAEAVRAAEAWLAAQPEPIAYRRIPRPPRPGGLAPFGLACTIEDWRWSYSVNEFFDHGGFVEIDGVVVDYPAGRFPQIHLRLYDGPKGDQYVGNESTFIEPGGGFEVMVDAPRPAADKLAIKYNCSG